MTVLVTGGLGYLGSRLIRELPDHPTFSGHEIRILDNYRQPRFHSLWDLPSYADYSFVDADIRDEEAVREAMEGVDAVFHLAAVTNAPETFDIPEKTWEVNYEGAMTTYEAARDAGVSEFVNVSTCSVYGRTEEEIDEGFDCDPESPYGEAKLEAEQEMLDRYDGGMGLTALRLGTVYGWTTGMRFDTVVDKFALLAATGEPLTVYEGAENQKRPYLHVHDSVRSMLFAASELGDGEAYNVVGQNGRLQDVVDAIEKHFPEVDIGTTEAEQLNQLSYIVSDEKISSEGFETCYTLDQGVEELADKFRALTN
ncbi:MULTISPECIES: NAD-dependent epimerase/dehydratase family protein [Haloarcula]|uniref:NAD-dependent dehydratase n=1 Tax=Haloarcula pellucida TaxID=1427151 RepID=A0A830GMN8_9EURY|nr:MULTISPECIES: NAD(P)-dependent oxidoreductase [Halomicroarcula]MBX0348742.1 NAD(P)-dependent oxidoreductase [Halomicroarcula pellucida]MDS0278510.1 NAD(P)-dependent oxidoreductase [Halomicroarcula sp. S1AR25-4]GGN91990.1 NAD-dependent dehydratase [Halomicroarcula pellucida]